MQGWPSGSVPQVLGLGRMGLGDLQKPPSHSTEEVPDSHRRLLGQGTLRRTQRLLTPSGLAPAFPQGRRGPRAACSCSCCWNSAWARSRSASTSSRWAAASLCRAWASGPAPRSGQGGQGGLAGPGKAATTHIRWLSLILDLPCALRILKGGRAHTHSSPAPAPETGQWPGRHSDVLDKLWEVSERAKGRDFLNPLPPVALEPFLVSASRLGSMLKPSRNFILEVDREKDKAVP